MRTIAEIDTEIAAVKDELSTVRGKPTEVYARIVGYYRSVRNWNRGKREEYNHRKLFVADETRVINHLPTEAVFTSNGIAACPAEEALACATDAGSPVRYELFSRKACPNCPPVKETCQNLPLSGSIIDVDSEEGRALAIERNVFSTPTVIFYDAEDAEAARAYSTREIRSLSCLAKSAEPATTLF